MGRRCPATAAVLLLLGTLAGCVAPGGRPESRANDPTPLSSLETVAGGEWRLVGLTLEDRQVDIDPEATPTLSVEETGRIQGLATLNRYFGQLELEAEGRIRWAGPLGSTMMAGPEPLMDQETAFLKALEGARRIALSDGRLILRDEDRCTVLAFEKR